MTVRNSIQSLLLTLAFALAAVAQPFSSGSTGADGALDLTNGNQTIQLPPSGIFNYTTVNIPNGRTLTFTMNLQNTPVVMLAQGTVTISGLINVSAPLDINLHGTRTPGPGGFEGGDFNMPGFGPAPGLPASQSTWVAQWVGPLSLVPIIGGSGGAGFQYQGCPASQLAQGGGGGGAILIASSTSIALSGQIWANGSPPVSICGNDPLTSGAPGAIRLVANSVTASGNLSAAIVRLEAPLGALSYSGSGTPPVLSTINPTLFPANPPSLTIVSVGGYPVPSYSGSSFTTI